MFVKDHSQLNTGRTYIKKGQRISPKTEFKKGHIPWNKGLTRDSHPSIEKYAKNLTGRKRPEFSSEKHPNWKGEKASYEAKHAWVKGHFGKPSFCEGCSTQQAKQFDWANISGEYKRKRSDWIRLCISCHVRHDRNYLKRKRDSSGRFIQ